MKYLHTREEIIAEVERALRVEDNDGLEKVLQMLKASEDHRRDHHFVRSLVHFKPYNSTKYHC